MVSTTNILGKPADRPDRLITLTGLHSEEWAAEYSVDGGRQWNSATIYIGTEIDAWRTCDTELWNRSVQEGILPPGEQGCLWNYFFDVEVPAAAVQLRLKTTTDGKVVLEQTFDLSGISDLFVIDHRNAAQLAGGRLSAPWTIKQDELKKQRFPSLFGKVESEKYDSEYPTSLVKSSSLHPLSLQPNLTGWHRVYMAMKSDSSVRFSLSNDQVQIPVPDENEKHLFREYSIIEADLTGQDIRIVLGGGPKPVADAWIQYIRFVPMTDEEITQVQNVLRLTEEKGNSFIGYIEPVTYGYHIGEAVSLKDYMHNEMQLNKLRGCTDVYLHVLRMGLSAWYHSDIVDHYLPQGEDFDEKDPAQLKWTKWMQQGDPLAIAVKEARLSGLKIFADMGMNITFLGTDRFHYRSMTSAFSNEHPEYMCADHKSFFDYRNQPVQDYAAAIAHELMHKYDVDGIHLDFARFAYKNAFDKSSLVNVVERIHNDRCAAQEKWGHPVQIAVRIPSYLYHHWDEYTGDYPEFVAALEVWAQKGWIDRVMACCMVPAKLPELSLQRYNNAVAGTNVELWGDLYAGLEGRSPSQILEVALKWQQEGLNGGFFFYEASQPIDFRQINRQLRLLGYAQKEPT